MGNEDRSIPPQENKNCHICSQRTWSAPSVINVIVLAALPALMSRSDQKAHRSEYWSVRCLRYNLSAPRRTFMLRLRSWNLAMAKSNSKSFWKLKTQRYYSYIYNIINQMDSKLIQGSAASALGKHHIVKKTICLETWGSGSISNSNVVKMWCTWDDGSWHPLSTKLVKWRKGSNKSSKDWQSCDACDSMPCAEHQPQ